MTTERICIIGAGWYGCHLGMVLKSMGKEFIIYEKASEIFTGSSYNNQNRLHIGFHYARSLPTRELCKNGYYKFLEQYGNIVEFLNNNYYCVAKESNIDYGTYKIIMEAMNVEMEEVECEELKNIEGILNTKEGFVKNYVAKAYFQKELGKYIETNVEISKDFFEEEKNNYEFIFNCTNNVLNSNKDFYYEKTLSLIYQKVKNLDTINGYTLVDGPLCSLYPYDMRSQKYTLTDVEKTPLHKSYEYIDIINYEIKDFIERREYMENKIRKYHKNFDEEYKYVDHYTSLKIKKISKSDERLCYINQEDNIINVFCDKILGIFIFEDYVKKLLMPIKK